jgi:thioesterase domain-containing protein
MDSVERAFGVKIPLSTLFKGATVEYLACLIREKAPPPSWSPLIEIQSGDSGRPFFCVHPVGGNVLCYLGLARSLGADQPFYGLQASGVEEGQTPLTRIEDMASRYIEALRAVQPEGPYILGGWSLGGVVAFEMAQQLRAQGETVDNLILLDSQIPALHQGAREMDDARLLFEFALNFGVSLAEFNVESDHFRQLDLDGQLTYVLEQAKAAHKIPSDIGLSKVRQLLHVFKANVRALNEYLPQHYPGRITLFKAGEQFGNDSPNPTSGWNRIAADGLDLQIVDGNHYSMLSEPHLTILSGKIRAYLNQAEAGGNTCD